MSGVLELSGTNAPANFPDQSASADAVAYTPFNQMGEMSAFVRLTANPPFLDQLDHGERQAAAQAQYDKRNQEFTPAMGELCIGIYQAAILMAARSNRQGPETDASAAQWLKPGAGVKEVQCKSLPS